MTKIRVLLALLRVQTICSLKTRLMQEPDIEIVGEADGPVDVLVKVGGTNADVVAIDLPVSGKDSGLCSHLLAEYPRVKIIAISERGNTALMYKTGVIRRWVPDTSLENLVDLIRWSMTDKDATNGDDIDRLPGS